MMRGSNHDLPANPRFHTGSLRFDDQDIDGKCKCQKPRLVKCSAADCSAIYRSWRLADSANAAMLLRTSSGCALTAAIKAFNERRVE